MKSERERMDIISAYRETGTYRATAQMCGTTHKTVKRVIDAAEAAQTGQKSPARPARPRNYEAVTGLVAERVKKSSGRISAKRLLPIARVAGYQGSPRNFRRLVAQQKMLWRNDNHRGRRPATWTPGEYLVMDWAEAAPGLQLFCAVLAFSRWRFTRFAADQRQSTTLAMLAEAFDELGGVPAKVLTDRMGCLKGGVVAGVMVPTVEYVRFATHYGFEPDWCHAADPQSKGIVESLCGYAQTDLAVPLLTEAGLAGRELSLARANAAAKTWCAEVNSTIHSEIAAVPDDRLAVERELLTDLPSLRLPVGATSARRKVDRLSCVRYGSARYSVPNRFIGHHVNLVIDSGSLLVVEDHSGVIVAEHELLAPGEVSINDDHYDQPRPTQNRGPRPKTVTEQQFCALGIDAQAFLVGSAAAGNTRLGAELGELLALGDAHGHDDLVAALRRAVAFKRFRAADVRSILAAGAGAPHPRPAGNALVVDLPVAGTRSLDAYKISREEDAS
ncbi:IS21 family transposase [Nocardia sp. NPDC058480]|uniref:IS21 family transposase n=1 Tax=unclassified Nocardia TaxID=2637762 RepID=UPI00365DB3DD